MNNPNHDPLEKRLQSLARSIEPSDQFTSNIINRLSADSPTHTPKPKMIKFQGESGRPRPVPLFNSTPTKRWIMRTTLGLAACALITTFTWTLLVHDPQPAYGIADIRARIQSVQSILIAGHNNDGSSFEMYADRPNRSYTIRGPIRTIMTADQQMLLDDNAKTATLAPCSQVDARYFVEELIQNMLVTQLLGPANNQLQKIRTEQLGNITADVYTSKLTNEPGDARVEILFNPATGLPIKSVLYAKFAASEPEIAAITIDHIQANPPPPAGIFDFKIPAGYKSRPAETDAPQFTSASTTNASLQLSYTFEVADSRALLVCWAFFNPSHPTDDLLLPPAALLTIKGPKCAYTEHLLHADPTQAGYHWRWSLLLPADPSISIRDNPPQFRVTAKDSILSLTMAGVHFDPQELATITTDAQKRTLPPEAKPMTLNTIEAELKSATK